MDNNTIKIVSDYLKKIEENLKVLDEKKETLKALENEITKARASENVGIEELGQKIVDFQKLEKEIEGLKELSFEYNAWLKIYNEEFARLNVFRAKADQNINDVLYGNSAPANLYKTSTKEEKIEFEMSKSYYESQIESIRNSMNVLIEPLERLEQKTKNAIKGKNDNYRELTIEEAKKLLSLTNKMEPLTNDEQKFIFNLISETGAQNQDELVNNAKSLAGISEKSANFIGNNSDNYRELTLEEAKELVGYEDKLAEYKNKLSNDKLTDEEKEIIKTEKKEFEILIKPRLDVLRDETGIENFQDLFDEARAIAIENFQEQKVQFVSSKTVDELCKSEENYVKSKLGLGEDSQINDNDLSSVQSGLTTAPLKKEDSGDDKKRSIVKRIGEGFSSLKERVDLSAANAVKAIGTIALVGVAVVAGGIAIPELAALAAGGLGVKAMQDFNKGKKL